MAMLGPEAKRSRAYKIELCACHGFTFDFVKIRPVEEGTKRDGEKVALYAGCLQGLKEWREGNFSSVGLGLTTSTC